MARKRWCVDLLSLLAVSGLLIGCGGTSDAPPKAVTAGKVTFNGEPVKMGMIRFIPDEGPPVQTEITDGEYRVTYKGGVALGKARVEIDGFRESSEQVVIAPGVTQANTVQFIPEKYNHNTTLSVEITGGKPNEHDFELTE